ncbi:MAG: FAD-dependent oxidoreductase [Microthrixaceae bacterium]
MNAKTGQTQPDRHPLHWGIVGGGVLGMSLALRLAGEGHRVTLWEGGEVLGGLAAPWQVGDVTWDRHYHVTLLSDSRTQALYRAAGIGEADLRWVETRNGYYGPDRTVRPFSDAADFLRLPGLSLLDKVRLGGTIVVGSRIRDGRRMERLTAERWLRRWSGTSAFDAFWRPLLRAKLGDAYPRASAAFIWATIQRLYQARRSGLKKEMFGYVGGGYAHVCERLHKALVTAGVDVVLGATVREVRKRGDRFDVSLADDTTREVDRVIVTTGSRLAAAICPDLLTAERERLERVEYLGVVCVSLVLRRPLGPYYLTYITESDTPFTAVVEMTAFVDPAEMGGRTLVYLPKYTSPDDPVFDVDDDEIVAGFRAYLAQMYPDLTDDDVVAARVSKVRNVFAVPTLGFSDDNPSISTSVPGLYLAGSAHLPFSTLNVHDTLSLVDDVIEETRSAPLEPTTATTEKAAS